MAYQGRLWITRPRPGVDRMSSAWLIRQFIDPRARFGFAADQHTVPEQGVPFDMFGVEFSHQGDGCTFETLCTAFGIRNPAVSRIASIVHDLDLKDGTIRSAGMRNRERDDRGAAARVSRRSGTACAGDDVFRLALSLVRAVATSCRTASPCRAEEAGCSDGSCAAPPKNPLSRVVSRRDHA